mmetsp:Transcript_31614/g.69461  ORF Transcript_31614/g.69461 Transcript_31614/m.69461 type:complete len:1019 (-) Transcript_31614:15-3071(-)
MSPPNDGGAYGETGSEKQHQQQQQQERDEAHLEANMAVLACGGGSGSGSERFMVGGSIPTQPRHDQRLQDRTLDTHADVPSCQDDAAGPLPLQSGQQPHRYPMQQARPSTERHGGTAMRRPQYDCFSSFANLSENPIVQQQQPLGQVSAATHHVSAPTKPAHGSYSSSVLATAVATRPGTAAPPMAATVPSTSMPRPVLLPTLSAQSLSGSSIGSLQSPTCSDVDTVRAAAAASTDNNMRKGPSSSSAVQRRNRVRTHQVMTADSSSSSSRNAAASSSNTSKSTGGTTTTTGNIKLQPAASNRIRCSADMQLLRTRRRMWLEEQARQIAREERRLQDGGMSGGAMSGNNSLRIAGVSASDLARAMVEDDPHRRSQRRHQDQHEQRDAAGGGAALADDVRRPSATADAAAQVASGMLGSPLPTPGGSGGVVFSGGGTATNHFHNRSVSIAGMVIPSPASDRFILNMPFGGGDIGGIGGGDDDGTVAQGLAEMAAMDGDNEDPGDVAYAADGIRGEATEFCMDEDSKEEEGTTDNDDDGSAATVLAEDDDQPVQGAAHRSMGQQRHYPSVPNLLPVKLPAIARRMSGGANYPISEDLVVPPRPRSSDPWLNSRRRFEAVDSRGPSTSQGDALPSLLEGGFVPPPRPHSSEPSFDAYVPVGGMGFQRKVVAAQQEVASGRIVSGPAPPPPLYNSSDDVVEDDVSSSRPSSRSSSRPPSVLKQPLLNGEETPVNRKELLKGPMLRKDLSPTLQFDSIPPPPLQGEEQAGQLKTAGTEGGTDGRRFSTNQTLGGTLQISFADGKGVEISLPSHLSAAPSFDTLRTSANETIAASAPPSSRLANVPTFDRSASIIDRGAGTVFADSCSGTGQALFTPPNARSKVSFSAASRGNENTPPSCADTRSSIPVTLPDLPHAPLSHQLPNITTFGRSASVGGHLLGSPESSTCRTPSNQVESSGQEDGVTKTGERLPSQQQRIPYRAWEPPFSQGPLPSLPLASPREEDEEEDTYEYASPPGGGPGGRF